jgi:hypothetical protein
MSDHFITPADMMTKALSLGPLPIGPQPCPVGTYCAITGQPIIAGYRVSDMVTDATAEFLDCFRGGTDGWVSDAAARCFKNADPRKGNPTARSILAFECGHGWNPLISREAAHEQGRPCWSELVRKVWPVRKGERMMAIITTDTKKRLWIRARVGTLGARTPVLCYDSALGLNSVRLLDWDAFLACLTLVEDIYSRGFDKAAIRECLVLASKAWQQTGWKLSWALEHSLAQARCHPEFLPALLIAQKKG